MAAKNNYCVFEHFSNHESEIKRVAFKRTYPFRKSHLLFIYYVKRILCGRFCISSLQRNSV